ncbi:AI-2E family transporter [Anaerotignum propionicum]|uniref:AI-2E family transporter n=1 Tax=Anaerotignum propionicum TaxID=28446 RepID=UPI002108D935|nr:AI-2E family transporter [Anaerotignum propionicum]MCQ4936815.1 AI-2E family transporter [Anaerotignum propionicum]
MRLPWNKKYLVISFHVIFTVSILVILGMLLFQLSEAKNVVTQTARGILAVFAPLLWAIFFSVLFEPLTHFLQRQYEKRLSAIQRSKIKNRKVGTGAAYIIIFVVLFLGGRWAAKGLGAADLEGLAEQLSAFVRKIGDYLVLMNLKLAELGVLQNVEGILSAWTENATLWIQEKIMGITAYIPQIGNSLIDITIGLTVAFYFLMEKEMILSYLREFSLLLFGEKATRRIRRASLEVNNVIMGYLGGQMTDAVIMAILFSISFTIVGLPYGVVLGLISGFSNLIPYFGAFIAFILAIMAGLLSGESIRALYASILILILQQIDSVYIVPKVVGKKVEMHPVLVLLSLAIFGRIFGFWGLLFAVPLGALINNFFVWFIRKKQGGLDVW